MVYRNWKSYQDALVTYNAARAQHESEVQDWNQKVASFDKDSTQAESVNGCGCLAVIAAGVISFANSFSQRLLGWAILWGGVIAVYQMLDAKVRALQKRRFLASTPCPQFHAEEPIYEPPAENYAPPPRTEPPPTRKALTLDSALSTLGLNRDATLDDLKRAYRDRIRDYHPDRVSHLGAELRELAERKAKEINAACEYLRVALQGRERT